MLSIYLAATPFAIPVVILSAIFFAFTAKFFAAKLKLTSLLFWIYATSVASFIAITATPGPGGSFLDGLRVPRFDLTFEIRLILGFLSGQLNEVTLNIWIAIPMAITAVFAAKQTHHWWPVIFVIILPFVTEMLQAVLVDFDRSGFLFSDVAANLTGIMIGLSLGWLVANWIDSRNNS